MPGVYIKPAKRVDAPTRLCVVTCDTVERPAQTSGRAVDTEMLSAVIVYSERKSGAWTTPDIRRFHSGTDVHTAIESLAQDRRRLYVVSPSAAEVWKLTGWWSRLTLAGARWDRIGLDTADTRADQCVPGVYYFSGLVSSVNTDIARYRRDGKHYVWISGRQFFQSTDEELEQCVSSYSTGETNRQTLYDVKTGIAHSKAVLWLTLFQRLSDWWLSVRGGPFGLTIGQLAMSYFRKRLTPETIVKHDNLEARKLEDRAIFGGRATTWFFGDINDGTPLPEGAQRPPPKSGYWVHDQPIYHVDVRSMYPFLLATNEYPVKLHSFRAGRSVREVRELLRHYCVIANVEVAARAPEYPYRFRDGIIYPTGRFHTTLCGDELASAIDRDEIRRVFHTAVYVKGRPFACMASELLRLRTDHRTREQPAWELFVKLLSNSFGGKLAQRRTEWIRRHGVPCEAPDGWGQWQTVSDGFPGRFRACAHLVWECVECEDTGRPMGAAFAYLTMYGRWHMRCIRELLTPQCVVSQDTDGMWVDRAGLAQLPLCTTTGPESAGMLRHTHTTGRARFYGPKWYYACGQWTLAGYHDPVPADDGLTFEDWQCHASVLGSSRLPDNTVRKSHRLTSLNLLPKEGGVAPSGWLEPYLLR